MIKVKFIVAIALFFISLQTQAQADTTCYCLEEWDCTPIEKLRFKTPFVLFSDFFKEKEYIKAKVYFEQCDSLVNILNQKYPNCFKSDYLLCKIKGIILFQNLFENTTSQEEKSIYENRITILIEERKRYKIQY